MFVNFKEVKKMKKLRLLMTTDCNRNCEGCCNKDWDITSLPFCENYSGYDEIMLTGGEPLLYPTKVFQLTNFLKNQTPKTKVFLYTALPNMLHTFLIAKLDGVCITLHENSDILKIKDLIEKIELLNAKSKEFLIKTISFRLNIFDGVDYDNIPSYFQVKDSMKWIENCPLPEDEVFMRWKIC